jgi:hypothetical protein
VKYAPFSPHSRPKIIRQVIEKGEWSGTTFGVKVTIRRQPSLLNDDGIQTQCQFSRTRTVSFPTSNVTEAMNECNRLITRGGR